METQRCCTVLSPPQRQKTLYSNQASDHKNLKLKRGLGPSAHGDRAEFASPRATQSFLQLPQIQQPQPGQAFLSFCIIFIFTTALSSLSFNEISLLFKCSNKNQNHQKQDLDTRLDSSRTKFFHARHGDRNLRSQKQIIKTRC